MDDQEKHRYCTNKFIELANQLKDKKTHPTFDFGGDDDRLRGLRHLRRRRQQGGARAEWR